MKILKRLVLPTFIGFFLSILSVQAQNTVLAGKVTNVTSKEGVSAVSVSVEGTDRGTFTDDKGNFKITVNKVPATLIFTAINFEAKSVVFDGSSALSVEMKPSSALGTEVVVSATRTLTKIMESPVSIERVNNAAIRNAPAASFYDVVSSLKGVDVVASSLTFKTPSTRGFNGSGNARFTQLIDGMDNQAPGLNFSVGSVIGLSELDVDNMELLPGASSALYGPGGMNGTLLINSKNPFKYQGLSAQVKVGIMNTDNRFRKPSPYHNWGLRWAKKVSDKFAFKITTEFVHARDWLAADERNFQRTSTVGGIAAGGRTNSGYDGVNLYGDETNFNLTDVLNSIAANIPSYAPLFNSLNGGNPMVVSRTGWLEKDVVNPNTINYKLGGSLNYKLSPGTEASLMGYIGTGNTVYTGSDRYALRNLKMAQYKFEITNKKWFVRAYTTQENSGDSYNATIAARLANEAYAPTASTWAPNYINTFLSNIISLGGAGNEAIAHARARAFADALRPAGGSQTLKNILGNIASIPISKGGAKFLDRSDLYVAESQYNLTEFFNSKVEVLIGGNMKRYVLNSEGTLFADAAGPIGINEFGGYLQLARSFLNGKLKITTSGRYDKNQNFKGKLTPRVTALVKFNENSNLRLSYQTAYRFPTTQGQWIDLSVGGGTRLLGGLPELRDIYQMNVGQNPAVTLENARLKGTSLSAADATPFAEYKPEQVNSYEVGFKTLQMDKKLLIDIYGYYGQYTNFLARQIYLQPKVPGAYSNLLLPNGTLNTATVNSYSVATNSPAKVSTYGYGIGLDYKLPNNFVISANGSSDVLNNSSAGFITYFSTPKFRANASIGNTGFGKSKLLGFNIAYKWQDKFFYESDFITGDVPSFSTLDAQFSVKIPNTKSIVKFGANNLLNQYYITGMGNPAIGGLYYVSFGYNVF